jgi:energy-coupling factor transporter ATP-binding protein EcfA2
MTLQMDEVSFSYKGKETLPREVISGVSLSFGGGERVVIMGEEGSGKTTVLRLLDGLLTPDRGRVTVDGMSFGEDASRDVAARCRIGFAFQYSEEQFVGETLAEDFNQYLSRRRVGPEESRSRALSALSMMGMAHPSVLERSPYTLSPGESRLVSIAQVISGRPNAILLDEPTAALDVVGNLRVKDAVLRLCETGTLAVIATHDVDFAAEVATRVAIIDEGRVVADGPAAAILTDARLLQRYGYSVPEAVVVAAFMRKEGRLSEESIMNRSMLLKAMMERKGQR